MSGTIPGDDHDPNDVLVRYGVGWGVGAGGILTALVLFAVPPRPGMLAIASLALVMVSSPVVAALSGAERMGTEHIYLYEHMRYEGGGSPNNTRGATFRVRALLALGALCTGLTGYGLLGFLVFGILW